jgi:hypothetical protein
MIYPLKMVIFHGSFGLPEGIVHRVTSLVSPALVRAWNEGNRGTNGISACNMGVSENGIYPNMALWKGTWWLTIKFWAYFHTTPKWLPHHHQPWIMGSWTAQRLAQGLRNRLMSLKPGGLDAADVAFKAFDVFNQYISIPSGYSA